MAFWQQVLTQSKTGGDLDAVRARYGLLFARFGEAPPGISIQAEIRGAVGGEWVGAAGRDPARALLYFHGGGFVAGSPETHRPLVAKLVEASGVPAFAVQYRLAPANIFPAPVRDGLDAYRMLLAKGLAPGSILLAGDEAGGGLAFAVALAIRNAGLDRPGGIAALSPFADLALSGLSMHANRRADSLLDWETLFLSVRAYLKKSNPCDSYASPAFASFKDFPPIMVHAGANEILRDDASKLGDRAAEAGAPVSVEIYDGMGHLFQADARFGEAKASLARLAQFIRTRTASLVA